MRWRERDGIRWLEAELPGARAMFTARRGGTSKPPYESLNLGLLTGDEPGHVRDNRRRAATVLGLDPDGVLLGLQVHGADVEHRDEAPRPNPYADPGSDLAAADAQATVSGELAPAVLVADCLPVALAGEGGVAMAHAGWRGLAGGVLQRAAAAVEATSAVVGPGIGPCCYEVGEEVLAAFSDAGGGIATGRMLDLRAAAVRALEEASVHEIEVCELCTSCEPELFFSHRRDGAETGRQAGFIRLAGGGR